MYRRLGLTIGSCLIALNRPVAKCTGDVVNTVVGDRFMRWRLRRKYGLPQVYSVNIRQELAPIPELESESEKGSRYYSYGWPIAERARVEPRGSRVGAAGT